MVIFKNATYVRCMGLFKPNQAAIIDEVKLVPIGTLCELLLLVKTNYLT